MATLNDKFLREELEAAKQQIAALRKSGKVSPEADAVFRVLMPLLTLLLAVLLEKTTRKNRPQLQHPALAGGAGRNRAAGQPGQAGRQGQRPDRPQSAEGHHRGNGHRSRPVTAVAPICRRSLPATGNAGSCTTSCFR